MVSDELLESLGGERLAQGENAWALSRSCRLFGRSAPWEERQERLLEELFHACATAWYVQADDLDEAGTWAHVAHNTYRLPSNICGWAFFNTPAMTYGNWFLYASGEPQSLTALAELFRAPPAGIVAWMEEHGLSALVASYPDDIDWAVYFARPISTG